MEELLAVNDLSAALPGGWQLAEEGAGHWRVVLVPASGADPTELAALQALVLLVEAGGWARLGRCARPGCPAVFLDATSGSNRRTCRAHQRSR